MSCPFMECFILKNLLFQDQEVPADPAPVLAQGEAHDSAALYQAPGYQSRPGIQADTGRNVPNPADQARKPELSSRRQHY
jgi:hypothetical protein